MSVMPLSTDKPPAFGWVERFFNDPAKGLLRRRQAYDALSTNQDQESKPFTGGGAVWSPTAKNTLIGAASAGSASTTIFDHFMDHWIGPASGQPATDVYWPTLTATYRDKMMSRVLGGIRWTLAAGLLVDADTPPANGVYEVNRSVRLWWVCANEAPESDLFGVRVFVDACDVTAMFLTPLPAPLAGDMPDMTDFSASAGVATEVVGEDGDATRIADDGTRSKGLEPKPPWVDEIKAVKDATKHWVVEDDTCCAGWSATLDGSAAVEGVLSVPTPDTLLGSMSTALGYDVFDGTAGLPEGQTRLRD